MQTILKLNPICVYLFILAGISSCSLSPNFYLNKARKLAIADNWQEEDLFSHGQKIKSFTKISAKKSAVISIYIEGDGFAWKNRWSPSHDPTPKDPLSLRLALQDPWPITAYLARPCQFLDDINNHPECSTKQWTSHRYSAEIVMAMSGAIDQLKHLFNVEQIGLTGYSGGGTLAALIAEQRDDVAWIITIAANIDHQSWTSFHRVTPLFGSLNPIDNIDKLTNIPQLHLSGDKDKIVPSQLVQSFVNRQKDGNSVNFIEIHNVDHECCWPDIWPDILNRSEFKLIRRKRP